MRVSIEWLKELVDIDCSIDELAEKLTMSGIAVEEIEDQAAQYEGIVLAKVLELEKHAQADNLFIVKVDAGEHGIKQVITAAKNLQIGDLVPLALPGTVLSDEKRIEAVTFKNVISQGMLCSGAELGVEKESTGIWVFDGEWNPGTPAAIALGATDQVLILELTANRPDCLGMIGVAREVAAIFGSRLKMPTVDVIEKGPSISGLAKVSIEAPDLCPRYAARVFQNVTIKPSPDWMQRRLRAAGIRAINNIVDITNYVMMEFNQPLHAFDLDKITDHHIVVRRAVSDEKLITLDEVERRFDNTNLLIADPYRGLCVAGVMGGSSSEITDQTTSILLESAYFNPESIRKTAKFLEMKTESSLRFERGIDPNGVIQALNRAAYLIQTFAGAVVAQGYIDVYPTPIEPVKIKTSPARINGWLGTDLSDADIRNYLERVHMNVVESEGQLGVTVPTFRRDISHMADLAEEVARLYGYDRIPVTIPATRAVGERTLFQKFQYELRRLLQGSGLSEIMTYSLYSKNTFKRLGLTPGDRLSKTVDLMLPLSEDQATMRSTLIPGMLEVMAFNAKRRQTDLAMYEIARVYHPKAGSLQPEEPVHLSVGLMGHFQETGWNQRREEVDFYDIKGILELIAAKFKIGSIHIDKSNLPYLHPGQSAEVFCNGQSIGCFGQVHPRVLREYEIPQKAFILEINLSALAESWNQNIIFKALPKFPAIERDLALILPIDLSPDQVIAHIRELGGELLENVQLFDVYQGEQLPSGSRSLAFRLSYRSKERTLSDNEVNQVQTELLQKLNVKYGAVIRS